MSDCITLPIAAIAYREDLYPRFKPDPKAIQSYAENVDRLPPIEVNQDHILIDGYHRWKAHETAGAERIRVIITETQSEMELLMLAVKRNAAHGQQLSPDEKSKYARNWWDAFPPTEICEALSISMATFNRWTAAKQQQREEEIRRTIFEMHLRCATQAEIAKAVGLPQQTVADRIADFTENEQMSDLGIFRDFTHDGETSARRLYTIWNFAEATNEVRHFGNIPPEIVDNLMFLYTRPFDVVFDPFGGGGGTIDRCVARKRRYYVSDLTPIPARVQDIRQHDITTGLPADLPVPDLVFLDPPYWRQAEKRYSQKESDLANMDLEKFLDTIGAIARDTKRKWTGAKRKTGTLTLIIGPWKEDSAKLDLPFLCYERIGKYLPLKERIIVPYSTQVHGGAFVKTAKETRQLLYLHRDLMVFGL